MRRGAGAVSWKKQLDNGWEVHPQRDGHAPALAFFLNRDGLLRTIFAANGVQRRRVHYNSDRRPLHTKLGRARRVAFSPRTQCVGSGPLLRLFMNDLFAAARFVEKIARSTLLTRFRKTCRSDGWPERSCHPSSATRYEAV